jgi:hypothetical protein
MEKNPAKMDKNLDMTLAIFELELLAFDLSFPKWLREWQTSSAPNRNSTEQKIFTKYSDTGHARGLWRPSAMTDENGPACGNWCNEVLKCAMIFVRVIICREFCILKTI